MAGKVTRYDMLVSCPSDVIDELAAARTVIDDFNKQHKDMVIVLKDWHSAYPETKKGGPQEVLNHQLVDACDFAVAIFRTRFGTATNAYGSGTEEEICRMCDQGKDVLLYFLDVKVTPDDLQNDQLRKVKEFQKQHEKDSLYKTYDSPEDFRYKFSKNLELYIRDHRDALSKMIPATSALPKLTVCGVLNGKSAGELHVEYDYFDRHLSEVKDSLRDQVMRISAMQPAPQGKSEARVEAGGLTSGLAELAAFQSSIQAVVGGFMKGEKIVVVDETRQLISEFCDGLHIQLDDASFFDVGGLRKGIGGGMIASSPLEEEKYNAIIELESNILGFLVEKAFTSSLPTHSICLGAVSNEGKSYDEDIEIRLEFPGGCICGIGEFTAPDSEYVQLFNDQNMEREFFMPQGRLDVDAYSDYPPRPGFGITPFAWSPEESRRQRQEDFRERVRRIFCYKLYRDPETSADIWTFKVSKLNQNKSMAFPSILYFKQVPDCVAFEIRSKHLADVVKGKISVVK